MRRKAVIAIVVALIAGFAGGWFAHGLEPALSCKESGGWYSEEIRSCIYAEPSDAAINQATANAQRHLKSGS